MERVETKKRDLKKGRKEVEKKILEMLEMIEKRKEERTIRNRW